MEGVTEISEPNKAKSIKSSETIEDTSAEFSYLDKGWSWMVMFAGFINLCIIGGNMLGVGIIHTALLRKYRESVSMTSWAGTLQVGVCSLGAPLSSAVADTFSCRTAVVLSGLCFVAGYLGTAFAPNIEVAIFTCGIISGLGGALGYTANAAAAGLNFKKWRNIAFGFVLSGHGVGLFIFAPLMQFALDFYGPVGFFITLAAISANTVAFGTMIFPSKLERFTQKQRKVNANLDKRKGISNNVLKSYGKALFIKPVICFCTSMLLYANGLYVIFLYLPTYVHLTGFTAAQTALFMSLTGIFSVIGRLLTGFTANMKPVDEIWLYSGSIFIVALSTCVYPFISYSYVGQIVFFVLLGLFSGSCFILMAPIGIRFVGIQFVSAVIGIQLFFCGIGSLIGPVCSGIFVDNGGTYKECFIFSAVSMFLAAVLSASTTACSSKPRKDESIVQQGNCELSELLTVIEK